MSRIFRGGLSIPVNLEICSAFVPNIDDYLVMPLSIDHRRCWKEGIRAIIAYFVPSIGS
jgi:hypothetical protein